MTGYATFLPGTRMIVECGCCGGDGGWEVVTGYDPRDGEPTGYFEECPRCRGAREEEVEAEPIEQGDLDERSGP